MTGSHAERSLAKGEGRLTLPDQAALLPLYYDGGRLSSPSGGLLMVLGVRQEADGSGSIILEGTSSPLRSTPDSNTPRSCLFEVWSAVRQGQIAVGRG